MSSHRSVTISETRNPVCSATSNSVRLRRPSTYADRERPAASISAAVRDSMGFWG